MSYGWIRRPRASGAAGSASCAENRFLIPGYISCEADRHKEAPVGVFGGEEGLVGQLVKNPGTPEQEDWPSKVTGAKVEAGDLVQIIGPSGGGYGDPKKRDLGHGPERLARRFRHAGQGAGKFMGSLLIPRPKVSTNWKPGSCGVNRASVQRRSSSIFRGR